MLAAFGQLYVRVEPFMISERVTEFLKGHNIDNCFERLVGEDELHLKCLRDSALVDVHIMSWKNCMYKIDCLFMNNYFLFINGVTCPMFTRPL